MRVYRTTRTGFAWLELLLALAALALLFQLFPSLWVGNLWTLDIRNWPRTVWFSVNQVLLVALMGVPFGLELYQGWQHRTERRQAERATKQKKQPRKE